MHPLIEFNKEASPLVGSIGVNVNTGEHQHMDPIFVIESNKRPGIRG